MLLVSVYYVSLLCIGCNMLPFIVAGIGDLDDFGSLSTVPATVKVSSSKKPTDKPRITVMYVLQ